jgi:hypothetical protein
MVWLIKPLGLVFQLLQLKLISMGILEVHYKTCTEKDVGFEMWISCKAGWCLDSQHQKCHGNWLWGTKTQLSIHRYICSNLYCSSIQYVQQATHIAPSCFRLCHPTLAFKQCFILCLPHIHFHCWGERSHSCFYSQQYEIGCWYLL